MAQEFNPAQGSKNTPSLAQLDLLEALLSSENATYPWNPADPEAAIYFEEQDLLAPEALSEELKERSQHFYSELEQLWSNVTAMRKKSSTDVDCIQDWQHHFTTYVPQTWLEAIARQAQQVFPNQDSLVEKLVQCVHGLLPSLVKEDLLVLARPFASTMCSAKQASKDAISPTQQRIWDDLSEIEQAKASLAIARYALAQIKLPDRPHYNGQKEHFQ